MLLSSNADPAALRRFREWVEEEWGSVDPFEGFENGAKFPSPILAIDDDKLLGGLSFTLSAIPDTDTLAVWINALFVAPDSRARGIGSRLVLEAERVAAKWGINELYVYTHVPALYRKLGWENVGSVDGSEILKKCILNDQDGA